MGNHLKKLQIGLLGGSFDPIHWGHINLAIELMEKRSLDQVWFVLAQINPLKNTKSTTSFVHRAKMLELALAEIPAFSLNTIECERPPPSYTIDTIRLIQSQNDRHQFYLLLGDDLLSQFLQWRSPEEIVQRIPLLIASRSDFPNIPLQEFPLKIQKAIEKSWTKTRLMEISSTDIRNRLKTNQYCGHLLPNTVLQYIENHHLYKNFE